MTEKQIQYDFTQEEWPMPDLKIKDKEECKKAWAEHERQWKEYVAAQMKVSDDLPDGLHVGKIFTIGVADGAAYYQISKVFKTRVHLIWRYDLCPDRYSDHYFRGGGSVPREEVERHINLADGMRKIFVKR